MPRRKRNALDAVEIHRRTTRMEVMPSKYHNVKSRRTERRMYKQRNRHIERDD